MTQAEAEIECIKELATYNQALKMVLSIGINLQEFWEDFYKNSNEAPLLSDRRCKKIIEGNGKVLHTIQEYYEETNDNLKIMLSDCAEIIKFLEEIDNIRQEQQRIFC